jgi:hypothetical protein
LFSSIVFAGSKTNEFERSKTNERECKTNCLNNFSSLSKTCNNNYKENRSICLNEKNNCHIQVRSEKASCYNECHNLTNITEMNSCKRNCSINYVSEIKNCSKEYSLCRISVGDEKINCKNLFEEEYDHCKGYCENGNLSFNVKEEDCVNSGGLYQQLCKGPYFGITCSQKTYCLCGGVNNYTCPDSFNCEVNHGIVVRGRGHSLPGWKNLLGQDLGNIGICTT